jgi:glycosidase
MNQRGVDRRSFLRLCILAAGGGLAAACGKAVPEPAFTEQAPAPTSPATSPAPTSMPEIEIRLGGGDADAWAWSKQIAGTVNPPEGCQQVNIYANGVINEASQDGERFTAQVSLAEGENHLTATCKRADGQEVTSKMQTLNGMLPQKPKAVIRVSSADGHLILDASPSLPDKKEANRIIDYIWTARPGNPASVQVQSAAGMPEREFLGEVSGERLTLSLPSTDGEYYFSLQVVDQAGKQDHASMYVEVRNGQLRIPDYATENPAWVENAIVYGIVCHKYGPFAFKGIMQELDYLKGLGVTAIWLSPANVSPPDDYGYAVVDYFNLNPAFGTKADFHLMVQEAHARGIRVLMDFVPNHSSAQHPYYRDAQELQRESLTWDFYDRDSSGTVTHYFDWTHLPNLNYENPEVRRWMIEAFSYWVREFDVDGFRVDVAWGIRERRPDFWPEWRQELQRIKPDLFLLAEASARDPYYFDNGYDAAYDWTDQLGKWAWELVWDSYKHRLLTYNLDAALTNRPAGYHPDALVFRFLNNNDTGKRFITQHGEGMTRVATALLLTLPGIPCIYTGDEIGAEFHPYQDRGPLNREENYPGLREYHQQLIALRKSIPSLYSRLWQPLEIEPIPQEVYAYLRYVTPNDQPILVVLNFFEEPAEVELNLPEEFSALREKGQLYDLLAGEQLPVASSGPLHIPVPGFSARILASQDWSTQSP